MSAAPEPLVVTHAGGSYPVLVEPGALARLPGLVARFLPGRRVAVVTDATVGALYDGFLAGDARWRVGTAPIDRAAFPPAPAELRFPAGEARKTRETWARLTDALLAAGFGRDGGLVALGGGVAGDLAGFVAATYMRGIPYVQVPTTLLAMLDSSVGGKTGVDTAHGKNLVGAFHQPEAVIIDPRTLATLSDRELRAGLAEAVKHGFVGDAQYFAWLEAQAAAILARDEAVLGALVARSVALKAAVVSADERESGRRAVLNAGHTVAHALEHVSGYRLLHGEAVALGLVAEAALAERLEVAPTGTRAAVEALLGRLGLPVRLPFPLPADALLAAMAGDKKGSLRFALPAGVGRMAEGDGRWTLAADRGAVLAALSAISTPGAARVGVDKIGKGRRMNDL